MWVEPILRLPQNGGNHFARKRHGTDDCGEVKNSEPSEQTINQECRRNQ